MSNMATITDLVNMSKPYELSSDLFEGEIIVYIKGFTDENGNVRDSEYFAKEDRQGITWSIQVQGVIVVVLNELKLIIYPTICIFLPFCCDEFNDFFCIRNWSLIGRFVVPQSADNILFGNIFDRPLQLPWGTGAVLKFMQCVSSDEVYGLTDLHVHSFVDPTLEHDLMAQSKPWALSPLISTMPHFEHKRCPKNVQIPSFSPTESVKDSTDMLHFAVVEDYTHSAFSSPGDSSPPSPSSSSSSIASGKTNIFEKCRVIDQSIRTGQQPQVCCRE